MQMLKAKMYRCLKMKIPIFSSWYIPFCFAVMKNFQIFQVVLLVIENDLRIIAISKTLKISK